MFSRTIFLSLEASVIKGAESVEVALKNPATLTCPVESVVAERTMLSEIP